jgi:membrane-associated phospholipid phosphatase
MRETAPVALAKPRWSRGRALALAGVVVGALCLTLMVWVDIPLALAMHRDASANLVATFRIVTMLGNGGIWYSVAVASAAIAWASARRDPAQGGEILRLRLRAWAFMIVSMAASGILVNGIKVVVGRGRPSALINHGLATYAPLTSGAPDSWSFPSGHAQSIWAAMIALAWIFPPLRWPCFALAVAVSASRIIVGAHYLSDVFAGAYLAIAVAYLLREMFERRGKGDLAAGYRAPPPTAAP